jgi:hypothetical protein
MPDWVTVGTSVLASSAPASTLTIASTVFLARRQERHQREQATISHQRAVALKQLEYAQQLQEVWQRVDNQLVLAIVAPAAALFGVLLTTFVQSHRDRQSDRRALRDDRIRRLAGEYERLLKLCVATSDTLRQFEQWAGKPVPDPLALAWKQQMEDASREANDAQIRLMLEEETEQEVTIILNATADVALLYAGLAPGIGIEKIPTTIPLARLQKVHQDVRAPVELVRTTARRHLARLRKPLPGSLGYRITNAVAWVRRSVRARWNATFKRAPGANRA